MKHKQKPIIPVTRKVYSGINDLPWGDSGKKITNGCLVLEGGAFRGLYTGGALDAMMMHGLDLECTIGVSAGAMNGISYATGQIGYSSRINLGYRHDPNYVGVPAFMRNKGIIGFDFAFTAPGDLGPLRLKRIAGYPRRYLAVATSLLTGREEYFEAGETPSILQAIRASASMPYVSWPVTVEGKPYLDGGCACKIPYKWALEEGYEKIVIIRTRPRGYRKEIDPEKKHRITRMLYRKYPEFVKTMLTSDEDYNRQCEEIEELEQSGRAYVIYPSGPVNVGRIEKDMEKLGVLYHMGYDDIEAQLSELRQYLGIRMINQTGAGEQWKRC